MGSIDYSPKREGYRLTEEGEQAWRNWQDDYDCHGGCTCWRSAPCSICHHEYHPYSIEETDEYWVKEEHVEMSRTEIVDKSKEKSVEYKAGDKVRVIGNSNGHGYKIGSIVTLESRKHNEIVGCFYWRTKERSMLHCVRECDIEPCDKYEQTVETSVKESLDWVINSIQNETNQQTKGDLNMSNTQRRVVNVVLIDPDQGLPVEDSQVHDFGQIVTEDDDATTIQELIMTGDVQAKLDIHNKVRSERVDLDVLKRTGNEVKLQPVKLKQLKWIIK